MRAEPSKAVSHLCGIFALDDDRIDSHEAQDDMDDAHNVMDSALNDDTDDAHTVMDSALNDDDG